MRRAREERLSSQINHQLVGNSVDDRPWPWSGSTSRACKKDVRTVSEERRMSRSFA